MTPLEFTRRMEALCRTKDDETVKRAGLRLIMVELGAGVLGYLPALEKFMERLGGFLPTAYTPGKDGIGGTDGAV